MTETTRGILILVIATTWLCATLYLMRRWGDDWVIPYLPITLAAVCAIRYLGKGISW